MGSFWLPVWQTMLSRPSYLAHARLADDIVLKLSMGLKKTGPGFAKHCEESPFRHGHLFG